MNPLRIVFSVILFCTLLFIQTASSAAQQTNGTALSAPVWAPDPIQPLFATDGQGSLQFEDFWIKQPPFEGVTDHIIQLIQENNTAETYGTGWFCILHYPQGFGEQIDKEVARFAKTLFTDHIFDGPSHNEFYSPTHATPESQAQFAAKQNIKALQQEMPQDRKQKRYPIFISYTVSRAPGAVSVCFKRWGYGGGAHDNWTYHVISFDTATGKLIAFNDFFESLASFERMVAWLATQGKVTYSYTTYEGNRYVEHQATKNLVLHQQGMYTGLSMQRLIFTPQGLDIIFAPYEQGGFSDGDVHTLIPLSELEALGVNTTYWKQPALTDRQKSKAQK